MTTKHRLTALNKKPDGTIEGCCEIDGKDVWVSIYTHFGNFIFEMCQDDWHREKEATVERIKYLEPFIININLIKK